MAVGNRGGCPAVRSEWARTEEGSLRGILPNRAKQKLARGEVVLGCALGYPDPELVELMGVVGVDYVRIEGEHGPVTYTELEHLVRAAELFHVTPGARVPGNLPHEILHYLDR